MTESYEGMSDQKLIEIAKGLHWAIFVGDCFAVHDVRELDYLLALLHKRGYEISETTTLDVFTRPELEDEAEEV